MNLNDLHTLYDVGRLVIFVGCMAIAFICVGGGLLLRALAAKRWPKTEGTIVRSEVDVSELWAGDPDVEPSVSRYPIVE